MHVIDGLRPLLKKNGLMLISTNVVRRADYSMAFNRGGDFQSETNTFWYLSIPMLEYMVRYFNMTPIDCLYQPAAASEEAGAETQAGYLAVMCRANDDPGSAPPDPWAAQSWAQSWEYRGLCDQDLMRGQARSIIRYADGGPDPAGGHRPARAGGGRSRRRYRRDSGQPCPDPGCVQLTRRWRPPAGASPGHVVTSAGCAALPGRSQA